MKVNVCTRPPWEYVARGLYGAQIAWWFNFFKPSQFLILSFTELIKDPVAAVKRLENFMGIKSQFTLEMLQNCKVHTLSYKYILDESTEKARRVLRDFFKGPNEELYSFLAMHGFNFTPFQSYDDASASVSDQDPSNSNGSISTSASKHDPIQSMSPYPSIQNCNCWKLSDIIFLGGVLVIVTVTIVTLLTR